MSDQSFFDIVVIFSIVVILLIIAVGLLGVFRTPPKRLPPRRKDAVRHAASSNADGIAILNMLGVPSERVRKAVITIDVDCAVVVEVEMYAAEPSDDGELAVVLKNYKLLPVDEGGE